VKLPSIGSCTSGAARPSSTTFARIRKNEGAAVRWEHHRPEYCCAAVRWEHHRPEYCCGNLKFTTDASKPRPQGGIGQVQVRENRQEERRHNRRSCSVGAPPTRVLLREFEIHRRRTTQGTQVQQKVRMLQAREILKTSHPLLERLRDEQIDCSFKSSSLKDEREREVRGSIEGSSHESTYLRVSE
jgi:hypothetical protein